MERRAQLPEKPAGDLRTSRHKRSGQLMAESTTALRTTQRTTKELGSGIVQPHLEPSDEAASIRPGGRSMLEAAGYR